MVIISVLKELPFLLKDFKKIIRYKMSVDINIHTFPPLLASKKCHQFTWGKLFIQKLD